jgi:hypothetical protein
MKVVLWRLYGWLFWHWWTRLMWRAQWRPWHRALLRWFSSHGLRRLHRLASGTCYWDCPHCGANGFDPAEPPLFTCTDAGQSCVPGEPTVHWFTGIQTCPRCAWRYEIADSD